MEQQINKEQASRMIEQFVAAGYYDQAKEMERRLRESDPSAQFTPFETEMKLREFITQDPDCLKLKQHIRVLATVNDPVLIVGETGTGKEILARALHGSREGKYESINCAAIPEQLLESILFGYVKGSFTGADSDKPGLMQTCYKGTLHLDEIGELPGLLQGKLLRALQEKKIRRIGENKEIDIDCRIVCTTNKNLWHKDTGFRDDLLWRIAVFELSVKPLRSRIRDDIMLILNSLDKKALVPLKERERLKDYTFIGNVRELQAIVRRYEVLGEQL